jgi:hypothetical protein
MAVKSRKALPAAQANPTQSQTKTQNIRLILMAKKLQHHDKFKFITERTLKQEKFEMTRFQSAQLRASLIKGVYWVQIVKGGVIQWNWTLLHHFLLNGNTEQHQALLEEYMTTLPKAS